MHSSLVFTVFAIIYLVIAFSMVPVPLASAFYAIWFGFAMIKAIHVRISTSSGFAVKAK